MKAEKLLSACASKEDLIELILQSEDCQVEPIHSTLIEMARRKKIKNHTILTKYELKKALGLTTENKPRSQSYIFLNSPEESFEFATRKDAKKIKNHTILTKYELKKALGLTTENKPRSQSYIFLNSPEESFEFATRKDAMDGMNLSSTKLAKGIKNGKILIGNIEYKFERK